MRSQLGLKIAPYGFVLVALILGACAEKPRPAAKSEPAPAAQDSAATAAIAAQLPKYPLKVCVVSGESLDSMDGSYDFLHEERLVRLCCHECMKDFAKDPAMYIARIDSAAAVTPSGG